MARPTVPLEPGLPHAIYSYFRRMLQALAGSVQGWVLLWGGFAGMGAVEQPESALVAIRGLMSLAPVVFDLVTELASGRQLEALLRWGRLGAMTTQGPGDRSALMAGIGCYLIWGAFPLFWPLLKPAGALEILANRVLWSLAFVVVALLVLRRDWGWLATLRERWPSLLAASVLIAGNWLTYIWAVNAGHVVEASLGYFINPLVSIALGVLLFGERMGRGAAIGCALAALGVAVIASGNLGTLWISFALAMTFGLYGAVKKRAKLGALEGLFVESAVLAPFSLAWMGWLAAHGRSEFGTSLRASLLLVAAGILTAVPLWLFSSAAPHIPLGTLGVLQYLAPTIQFLLGLFVFGQHVSASYWLGLVLVWLGSAAYLTWAIGSARSARRAVGV